MAWLFNPRTTYTPAAEGKPIRARAFDHDVRPLLRTRTFWIVADIAQRLHDQGFVPYRRGLSEFLKAPPQNRGKVTASLTCDVNFKVGPFRHVFAQR